VCDAEKARHFCITTTSQVIGAAAAAPAAPLSTPLPRANTAEGVPIPYYTSVLEIYFITLHYQSKLVQTFE